jgi:TonB family protein
MPGREIRHDIVAALATSLLLAVPVTSNASGTDPAGISDAGSAASSPPKVEAKAPEFHRVGGRRFRLAEQRMLPAPRYPQHLAELGREGWVLLSFVVASDGTTRDAVVLDSSDREFEQPALEAVGKFAYEPGLLDGQPVESVIPRFRIAFALRIPNDSARQGFGQRMRRLQRNLDRNDLDGAHRSLADLEDLGALNLFEDAHLWWARAMLQRARGDLSSWRSSMLRAVAFAGPDSPGGLPADTQRIALELLYADYTRTGELPAAIDMFDQLSMLVGDGNENPELRAHAETVRNILAGDGPLQAQGRIDDNRPWPHTLWRDGFEFADIAGRLDTFHLWCERRALELEIDPDSSWQVPASWGACRLYVFGEPGTTFSLLEYSAAAEAPAPR